ncbi:hypothetical protein VE02_08180 [Pseudogymnoascus sp. 03VT05]|nr:hypothetical protein VE02_08180 [Pseudogymnoascus sp. 03VT05]
MVLNSITANETIAEVKADRLPRDLTPVQKQAIQEAQKRGEMMAAAGEREDETTDESLADVNRYYVLQTAFSGTNTRSGPPVDLCLQLLDCEELPNGRVRSRLLSGATSSEFYKYQVSGAVGCILKLYGEVDADKLLKAMGKETDPSADLVHDAAIQLRDLKLHGAILADEVGFGKTKQSLLIALLHSVLYTEMAMGPSPTPQHKPMLLIVPPTLIGQWIRELRGMWPCFRTIVLYSDHEYKDEMALSSLPFLAMTEYPSMNAVPDNLRFIFDPQNVLARSVIIITSYETHKIRTMTKMTRSTAGVPFSPPEFDSGGNVVWKKKPRKTVHWQTTHRGVYSLAVADEAQKVRNQGTGLWSTIFMQSFPKTMLVTATPIFNAVKDLVALYHLLWPMVKIELATRITMDPSIREWIDSNDDINAVLSLGPLDPRRLSALDPQRIKDAVRPYKGIHVRVATTLKPIMDLTMVQRSQASVLPVSDGEAIHLRGLFKRLSRKTAIVERTPDETIEYQMFHRTAAMDYINEIVKSVNSRPTKPSRADFGTSFIGSTRALRRLAIANFSTKVARLDLVMENAGNNTHVATLSGWRERGLEAEFLHELTRGPGEPRATTAKELLDIFCRGSPPTKLAFQRLLAVKGIEELDKEKYGRHQKQIVAVSVPVNAFALQMTYRELLVDARVLHAGLTNTEKGTLVSLFNDPTSSVKVLIMLFDVGAVGLNLHTACDEVLIATVARSHAQEAQVAGRVLRVTSEFPVTVIRRTTPNSHDQFGVARQVDKATVHLAANAQDPSIRALIVGLLNEFQPQVDQFHASELGMRLKHIVRGDKQVREIVDASRVGEEEAILQVAAATRAVHEADQSLIAQQKGALDEDGDTDVYDIAEEAEAPDMISEKRTRKAVDRYTDSAFNSRGMSISGSSGKPENWRGDTDSEDTKTEDEDSETGGKDDDGDYDDGNGRPDDEESQPGSDCDARPERLALTEDQVRDELVEREETIEFLRSSELEDFVAAQQPDDAMRHQLALLSFPPDYIWTLDDLDKEFGMRAELNLLYNKVHGKTDVHFDKSIHIRYQSFPRDVVNNVDKNRSADRNDMVGGNGKGKGKAE